MPLGLGLRVQDLGFTQTILKYEGATIRIQPSITFCILLESLGVHLIFLLLFHWAFHSLLSTLNGSVHVIFSDVAVFIMAIIKRTVIALVLGLLLSYSSSNRNRKNSNMVAAVKQVLNSILSVKYS